MTVAIAYDPDRLNDAKGAVPAADIHARCRQAYEAEPGAGGVTGVVKARVRMKADLAELYRHLRR